MSAIDILSNIVNNEHLSTWDFKYCLVDKNKVPYNINGTNAKPNNSRDFCSLDELINCESLESFIGIGISIKASNICAIDVDGCFSKPFDIKSADERAVDILSIFGNTVYTEFSFSGKGLRLLFKTDDIVDYSKLYYTKYSATKCEYYRPEGSARYVTITGRTIVDAPIIQNESFKDSLLLFLNKYLKRKERMTRVIISNKTEDRDIDTLLKLVKTRYLKNIVFQELWFGKAPGSNSNESELDYEILLELFNNITQDKEKLRILFESSPYFKTKDAHHIYKWHYNNYRYYEYMYERL